METSYIKDMNKTILTSALELSSKELREIGRTVPLPFQLRLIDSKDLLFCEQVLRIIPQRRMVAFGTWGNKKIVAKLFFDPQKAKQHIERDLKGIQELMNANIPTPKLYYQGSSDNNNIQVLIFERITNTVDIDLLAKLSPDDFSALLHALTLELATQHVVGILQHDLHFKNFLFASERIYTLDGGNIEKSNLPLSKKISLDNLGLFIAQLGISADKFKQSLFAIYAESRGWPIKEIDYLFLEEAIQKWQKQRWSDFRKKILRNCSAFAKTETAFSFIVYDRQYATNEFQQFLKTPDIVFSKADVVLLKNGRTSTVIKTNLNNQYMVIKRYNIKNSWHGLRRCLRPTRAATSWRLAHYLCLMGVPTAKPIAFIEGRCFGLRTKSYFVMDYIAGPHLGDYFATADLKDAKTLLVVKKVIELINNLTKLRLVHGDLKMTNILVQHDQPVLIDLDGMREYKKSLGLEKAAQGEWQRFLMNWDHQPEVKALFEKLLNSFD